MSREQRDTKIYLGSTKIYVGEHQEHNSGSREKIVKFQREPGAGDPPYGVSLSFQAQVPIMWLADGDSKS